MELASLVPTTIESHRILDSPGVTIERDHRGLWLLPPTSPWLPLC
jgi:hypothetical protein